MTNEEIMKALGASATLMRMIASGNHPENEVSRLRYWAGKLELTIAELTNRDASMRTLFNTFDGFKSQYQHGTIKE